MPKPEVSVIITCYNYGRFLKECVESVLNQSFYSKTRVEILVVDDGSTDETSAIVRGLKDSIRYLPQKHAGQGVAFNFGIRESQAPLVALLDADDTWHPDKLLRTVDVFHVDLHAGLVQHWMADTPDSQMKKALKSPETTRVGQSPADFLAGRIAFTGTSGLTFRKEMLKPILPVPSALGFCADEYLYHHVAACNPVWTIRAFLGRRRIHTSNWYASSALNVSRLKVLVPIRQQLDKTFYEHLKKKGLSMSPTMQALQYFETLRLRIFYAALAGLRGQALSLWWKAAPQFPHTLFWFFKRSMLFLAILSPRLYSWLQMRLYAPMRSTAS